jgi:hypothetical protein
MKPSQPSPDPSAQAATSAQPDLPPVTFEQELAAVETALQELRARHTQVQQDQHTQAQLHARQAEVKQALAQQPTPELSAKLQAELRQISDQLDTLSTQLESQLLSWATAGKPFWKILRFSGLGLITGWGLALWVLGSAPPPSPSTPPTPQEYQGRP